MRGHEYAYLFHSRGSQTRRYWAVPEWYLARASKNRPASEEMHRAGVAVTSAAPIRHAVAFFGSLVDELEQSFA